MKTEYVGYAQIIYQQEARLLANSCLSQPNEKSSCKNGQFDSQCHPEIAWLSNPNGGKSPKLELSYQGVNFSI